jgi:hypothetical protein
MLWCSADHHNVIVGGDFNFHSKSDIGAVVGEGAEWNAHPTENARNFGVAIPDYEDVWAVLHHDADGFPLSLSRYIYSSHSFSFCSRF